MRTYSVRPYKDGTRIGQLIFVLVTLYASNLRISAPGILRSSATLFKHLQRTPRKIWFHLGLSVRSYSFFSSSFPANLPPQGLSVSRLFASGHGEFRCCGDRQRSGINLRRVAEVVAS